MRFLLLIFPLFLFACGSSTQQVADSFSLDSAMKAAMNETMNLPVKTGDTFYESTNTNPDNDAGFKLMETEMIGNLKCGLDNKQTLAEMGVPETKSAAELWGADGLYHEDWSYQSKGIELNMSGRDSLQMEIWSLRFFAPCTLKTLRNIGIGSSFEEVKEAYKEEMDATFASDQTLIAGSVYGGMIFNFENGKLSSVFIGSAAE